MGWVGSGHTKWTHGQLREILVSVWVSMPNVWARSLGKNCRPDCDLQAIISFSVGLKATTSVSVSVLASRVWLRSGNLPLVWKVWSLCSTLVVLGVLAAGQPLWCALLVPRLHLHHHHTQPASSCSRWHESLSSVVRWLAYSKEPIVWASHFTIGPVKRDISW